MVRLPFVSRRRFEAAIASQARGYQRLIACLDKTHAQLAGRNADLAAELRTLRKEVAS